MEKCSRCGAPTQLFIGGTPVCPACDRRDNLPSTASSNSALDDERHPQGPPPGEKLNAAPAS
jgi:uncharacterized Zn finger protein (UPF0148 family)